MWKADVLLPTLFFYLFSFQVSYSQNLEWDQTSGPFGGSVGALTINSNDEVFAGTYGNIYRSSDNGENWSLINPDIDSRAIRNIVTVGENRVYWCSGRGVFGSADNGQTWSHLLDDSIDDFAYNSNGDLFVGAWWGVAMSSAGDTTWEVIDQSLPHYLIHSVEIAPDGDLFVGRTDGVWRTQNNGQTWRRVDSILAYKDVTALKIDADGNVFAGIQGHIFYSQDDGISFTDISSGLPDVRIYDIIWGENGELWTVTAEGVYYSSNHGGAWVLRNNGLENHDVFNIVRTASDILLVGSRVGIFKSIDKGESWQPENHGLAGTSISKIILTNEGEVLTSSRNGLFYSDDNGENWQLRSDSLPGWGITGMALTETQDIVVVTSSGVLFSENKGLSWESRGKELDSLDIRSVFSNGNLGLFMGTREGFYFSEDNGETWQSRNNGLSLPTNIAITRNSNNELFASNYWYDENQQISASVFRSFDNGESWEEASAGLPSDIIFETLESSPSDFLLVSCYDGTFRSENNGDSWIKVSDLEMTDFLFLDQIIYAAAGYDGVQISEDEGRTWREFMPSPGAQLSINSIEFDSFGNLLAGTDRAGIYRSNQKITSVKEITNLPGDFTLEQNYPNPFNPTTSFQFSLPNSAEVSMKIFNLKGNLVKTLISQIMPKGTHKIQWDGTNGINRSVSAGIYFYQLKTGGVTLVKKMTLIK